MYFKNDPAEGVFIIVDDTVIMIYKKTKILAVNPFKIQVV